MKIDLRLNYVNSELIMKIDRYIEEMMRGGHLQIRFGYVIENGIHYSLDKGVFEKVVNAVFHSPEKCQYNDVEGVKYYNDDTCYVLYYPGTSEKDYCYREEIHMISDWVSCMQDGLLDLSQINSKSHIGIRLQVGYQKKFPVKEFPPSTQYHHIENFSEMTITVGDIANINFIRLKDPTDNIITHQIALSPIIDESSINESREKSIRILSLIDSLSNIISENHSGFKNVRTFKIKDKR